MLKYNYYIKIGAVSLLTGYQPYSTHWGVGYIVGDKATIVDGPELFT